VNFCLVFEGGGASGRRVGLGFFNEFFGCLDGGFGFGGGFFGGEGVD
jgi:hypothetical protein